MDRLVNDGVEFKVGGAAGKEHIKTIELREPSLHTLGKHLAMFTAGLTEFLQVNHEMVQILMKDPSKLTTTNIVNFGMLPSAMLTIIADLVGETEQWVELHMTGKETVLVMSTYLDMIGWDLIVQTFTQAWQSWNMAVSAAMEKKKPATAPWSVGL
jgi:hypothetical protein